METFPGFPGFYPVEEQLDESLQPNPEKENTPDFEKLVLEAFKILGYVESPDLSNIRNRVVSGQIFEEFQSIFTEYEERAVQEIEAIKEQQHYMTSQIGLLFAKALMLLQQDMKGEAAEHIRDAKTYFTSIQNTNAVEFFTEKLLPAIIE